MGSVAVLFNVNAWLVTLAFFAACLAAAVLTLGILGYTSGLTGGRSLVATVILSLIVTAVVFVIPEGARRAASVRTS